MIQKSCFLSIVILVVLMTSIACGGGDAANNNGNTSAVNLQIPVPYGTPVLDGSGADEAWDQIEWMPIDQLWGGSKPADNDYKGMYKLLWDENNLYILAEITDDSLVDVHQDGLDRYWDDDCLIVEIDEDRSGGDHQYNHNAFSYHIALDSKVADVAPDSTFRFYDEHCISRRITKGENSMWEIAVKIYDGNKYTEGGAENIPKMLSGGKKMGFALAYSDNDQSTEREHHLGSVGLPASEQNKPTLNARFLSEIELVQIKE